MPRGDVETRPTNSSGLDTAAVNRKTRVVGRPSTESRIAGALSVGAWTTVATLVSLSDAATDGKASFVRWGAGLTVAVWISALYATSHIAVRDRELVFVDLLVERSVPASAIAEVHGDRGVGVTLRTGRSIGSLAYSDSVLQQMRPFPRSRAVADAIRQWLAAMTGAPDGDASEVPGSRVHWRARRTALRVLAMSALASYSWMVLLWGFAHPLRTLFGIPN